MANIAVATVLITRLDRVSAGRQGCASTATARSDSAR